MLYFCVFMFKKCAFSKKVHFFCIFLIKNLHISKKSCNFAPSFKKRKDETPIRNPKIETIMTTNNFKKAIEKEVKNYLYASAITNLMRIENFCSTEKKCGSTTVAIIAVQEDRFEVKRWRVYYNYSLSMKNEIAYLNFDNYSDACDEFAKFAR